MITIRRELGKDAAAREALLDLGYGAVRFSKVSHRLREGRLPAAGLAFVACDHGRFIGTVRLWDVAAGDASAVCHSAEIAQSACAGIRGGHSRSHGAHERGRFPWPSDTTIALANCWSADSHA